MKKCTFIGGVHGVGKSSLAGVLCVVRSDLGIMIDPDKLTIQCGGDEYEGGKLAVERIERALMDGVNFTQETTLSGGYPKRLCKRAKEAGYYIRLYYVGLNTLSESLHRIQNRVAKGGHDIPHHDVERRFSRRFDDIAKLLPYCDEAKFFDNDNGFVLVAEYRNGELLPVGDKRPAWLLELINAIK
mgnify:CR=1 FL=1